MKNIDNITWFLHESEAFIGKASKGEEHQEKVKHYFQLFLGNTPQVRSEPVL
jgi:hypothetical protein